MLYTRYNFKRTLWIERLTIYPEILPRNVRATPKDWSKDPAIVERLVEIFTPRTLRLLTNVDELEREVLEESSSHGWGVSVPQGGINIVRSKLPNDELQRTLQLARKAILNVPQNDLTEDFHWACGEEPKGSSDRWDLYKRRCRNRHAWGGYFCSDLDWKWDLVGSLKRMYRLPRKRVRSALDPIYIGDSQYANMHRGSESAPTRLIGSLSNGLLSLGAIIDGPVEGVRVALRSPMGEISYKTFFATAPSTSRIIEGSSYVHETNDLCSQSVPHGTPIPAEPDVNVCERDSHTRQRDPFPAEKALEE